MFDAPVGDFAIVGDFERSPIELSVDVKEAPEVLFRERPIGAAEADQASLSFCELGSVRFWPRRELAFRIGIGLDAELFSLASLAAASCTWARVEGAATWVFGTQFRDRRSMTSCM